MSKSAVLFHVNTSFAAETTLTSGELQPTSSYSLEARWRVGGGLYKAFAAAPGLWLNSRGIQQHGSGRPRFVKSKFKFSAAFGMVILQPTQLGIQYRQLGALIQGARGLFL